MLIINNKEYKSYDEKFIDFDPFEGIVNGKRKKCNVLYITLKENNFKLSIETTYDIEWIKELKIQDEKDISKYVIGLPYEDEKGWIYLSDKCNCTLCRINNDSFKINFDGLFEECNQQYSIKYMDTFKIDINDCE